MKRVAVTLGRAGLRPFLGSMDFRPAISQSLALALNSLSYHIKQTLCPMGKEEKLSPILYKLSILLIFLTAPFSLGIRYSSCNLVVIVNFLTYLMVLFYQIKFIYI